MAVAAIAAPYLVSCNPTSRAHISSLTLLTNQLLHHALCAAFSVCCVL
jgi:hypothetical protein